MRRGWAIQHPQRVGNASTLATISNLRLRPPPSLSQPLTSRVGGGRKVTGLHYGCGDFLVSHPSHQLGVLTGDKICLLGLLATSTGAGTPLPTSGVGLCSGTGWTPFVHGDTCLHLRGRAWLSLVAALPRHIVTCHVTRVHEVCYVCGFGRKSMRNQAC